MLEHREHLRAKHLLGLKRHSGHRDEHLAVFLKPHQRCGAHTVLNHAARRRHIGLRGCQRIYLQPALAHHLEHICLHRLVVDEFATKQLAQRRLRYVVFRRAEASGGKHHIGLVKRLLDCPFYLVGIVCDNAHGAHRPPVGIDLPRNHP